MRNIYIMNQKIREIIEKHFSQILTELDEVDGIDVDNLDLSMSIQSDKFSCKLGG